MADKQLLQLEDVNQYVNGQAKYFNNFKTNQDQKYFIYNCFKHHTEPINGYQLHKYNGSNQVILTYRDKEIYNNDNNIFTINSFKIYVIKLLEEYITLRDN